MRNAIAWLFTISLLSSTTAVRGAQAQPAPAAPQTAAAGPSQRAPAQADTEGGGFDFATALREGDEPMDGKQVAELAVKSAPTVARARAANDQARSAADQVQLAVYPRLDLQARYTRLSEEDPVRSVFVFGGNKTTIEIPPPVPDLYLLQAQLSYPVTDLFLNILPRYKAAQFAADAQALSARAEAQNVALQAREAFYNYARARAGLLVAQASLAQAQAQGRDVQALVSAGTLARVESMRADAGVAAAEGAVARAQGGVAVARTALRSLMHRDGESEIAITEDFSLPDPDQAESKEQLYAIALKNRSELKALNTMLQVHQKNMDASDSGHLPKLSVAGTVDLGNPSQRAGQQEHAWLGTWTLVGLLTWSPNDFATADAGSAQIEAQRAQTRADMNALEDGLRLEVARGYEDHKAAAAAMRAAQTGILAAEETYRVRREQFRAGAAVATDVIDAETSLRRARLELVNAAIDVRVARARLERAIERP
jgi:outer membrane protein TolC